MATAKTERWLPCATCSRTTRHLELFSVKEPIYDEAEYQNGESLWAIVQCQGYLEFSFFKRSEEYQGDNFEHEPIYSVDEQIYPSRIAGRAELKDTGYLPFHVGLIYRETRNALCNNMNILAGIGLRALVEVVCKEKNAGGNNLEDRINDLVRTGLLTNDGADILHSLRIMGNQAAHEVKPHSLKDLGIALDVVEHLLTGFYILPAKASALPKKQMGN
ncbi:MAG TPA: DUF4145 domain-containing protein [Flavobacteriales bacterium]|nr:DUF4145 domain-containing protein [Flavobacteriales bacterium]HMR26426.1 DUF4145 domain-containing protein [Flavobacteriales bacterium]